ncbi:MAG: PLDc N-terminal domain-containing protein [Pseudomonadales bacterium]
MNLSPLIGLIVLIADIYAIVMIVQSPAGGGEKIIWSIVILLLPVIGLIIWYFAGPGQKPF